MFLVNIYRAVGQLSIYQIHSEYLLGNKSCAGSKRCNKRKYSCTPCPQGPDNLGKGGFGMNNYKSGELKLKNNRKRRSSGCSGGFRKLFSRF